MQNISELTDEHAGPSNEQAIWTDLSVDVTTDLPLFTNKND